MPKLPDSAHKEQIREAAARLFVERGFGGTSIQDIADTLGVTRTAVYYYFKNKGEILRALVEEITVAAMERLARASKLKIGPTQRLRELVREYAMLILAHPKEFRVLDRSERDLPKDVADLHTSAKRQVLESFTKAVSDGIAAGEFRDVDARMAAFAILGMCNWTSAWFTITGRLSAEQIADAMADFALHAVRRNGEDLARGAPPGEILDRAMQDLRRLRRLLD
jgi:AcrR family transcriptional regulator